MATRSTTVRAQLWRGLMRYWSALTAADGGIDAASRFYNTALPTASKTNASMAQKAMLVAVVVLGRFGIASVRSLTGEVD